MSYRRLGTSGLTVSTLCIGTMMFGDRTDEAEATEILAIGKDRGINFVDTADVYSLGGSERITGRLIAADRHHWILASKFANPMADGPNNRGLSRRWMMKAIDESLARLGTDYLDIYYLHKEDPKTPLEETVVALGDLIRSGRIRYFGVSNYRAWRIAEIVRLCERHGVPRPVVCQPYYNALNRMPEVEVLPACGHFGLGVAPYSPIARGILTGKYPPGQQPPEGTRAGRNDKRIMQTEWREESLILAQTIKAHAETRGMTAAQFAVNWVLNNRLVSSAIVGPRTAGQMREYAASLDATFSAEDEALIDSLVATGHSSTPGYSDPAYPIEGRQPFTVG